MKDDDLLVLMKEHDKRECFDPRAKIMMHIGGKRFKGAVCKIQKDLVVEYVFKKCHQCVHLKTSTFVFSLA